jgi:uncharacterized lipoprotein NlpE involved in copper resistance
VEDSTLAMIRQPRKKAKAIVADQAVFVYRSDGIDGVFYETSGLLDSPLRRLVR